LSSDAISSVDGRYRTEAAPLAKYFSEKALMEKRFEVELAYLRFLVKEGIAPEGRVPRVAFSLSKVKSLEEKLGHDVKAVEVFIRDSLLSGPRGDLAPFVHLGLTSEDTNSLAFAVLLKSALGEVLIPKFTELALALARTARRESNSAMLARTHGRPAVPTTFGKEMAVFAVRMAERVALLKSARPMAKFSGAVGTYASFDLLGGGKWRKTLPGFVSEFGVEASTYSTQVVPGERLSDILHAVINLNQLMASLARDLWSYQAFDYVHFERPGKVSSSTMPQKENPVDLENAEGQVELSNSLLQLQAYKLQVTRMQRDLSDSVVRRSVGEGLALSYIAAGRIMKSLGSMKVDRGAMLRDLSAHPEVYAEREQILRRLKGDPRGYERVRAKSKQGQYRPAGKDLYLGEAPGLATECPSVVRRLLSSS